MKRIGLLVCALLLLAGSALADSLITMDGGKAKPGIVTAWSGSGKKVELTLKSGADANEVADAIKSQVDGVKKAKVKGGKVLVVGLAEADLLKALVDVELGGDDLGELAAAGMGDDDEGSGSSLRAKKKAKLDKLFKDRKTVAKGTVVSVSTGSFPRTVVKVRILSGPTGPAGKAVRKGKTIAFTPAIKMNGKTPDFSDENTQINSGAYFLQAKDRVKVKVGKATKGGFEAEVISR